MADTNSTENQKILAFLTALSLFFSAVEFAIPKPMPFLRIGLANIPLILGLFLLPSKLYFVLVLLKIFVQNLISGTLFSYTILFSVAGTTSSALIMFALHRLFFSSNCISVFGITLAGALFNSLAQLAVSYVLLFQDNIRYIAPFILASSLITGTVLGITVGAFINKSKWFALRRRQEDSNE
ncbi:MAG: Gx transporter family protein [Treponema sp.]|nr:Gx transporter family protein [Treponema sp.]